MVWLRTNYNRKPIPTTLILFLLNIQFSLFAQVDKPRYRVTFSEKDTRNYSIDRPHEFLSEKALERRSVENIPVTTEDIPVSADYLEQLHTAGAQVITTSKWFNTVIIEMKDTSLIADIYNFHFVTKVEQVYFPSLEMKTANKFINEQEEFDAGTKKADNLYGFAFEQIAIHRGEYLHNRGYRGKNVLIAVIDAGFYKINEFPLFDSIRLNQRLVGVKDFVTPGSDVFQESTHGMKVLSIIGGNVPEAYVGTAPDASFLLLRSEDVHSEFIVEEDYWVAAAEYADSAGVDVINTSLGYSLFDLKEQNHTYSDMNGSSTLISKAAAKAANKGITVVVSAGNSGNNPWGYITAPADAYNILAVGAINVAGELARFSSRGPSFDGRVKPEVVATGWRTFVQSETAGNVIVQGNGTSFAAPVITGLTACLHQAFPAKTNSEIISAVKQSSSRYSNPDTAYGHGIPNYELAYHILNYKDGKKQDFEAVIHPNPATGNIQVQLLFVPESEDKITFRIFNIHGKLVYSENFTDANPFIRRSIKLPYHLASGMYLFNAQAGENIVNKKILRINNGN